MKQAVYFGGPVITMRSSGTVEAVLVEHGRVRRAGAYAEVVREADSGARQIDLKGRTMLPAFIDPHSHITSYAATLGLVPLEQADSFDDIVERVRAAAAKRHLPDGAWINCFGYDHNHLKEGRHPDKRVLDRISGHPVLITHRSGHMGVMNTAALQAVGVTRETPDPAGGKIGRFEDGAPNGYLEETAFTGLASVIPPAPPEVQLELLERAQDAYLKQGITTVQDGLTRRGEWELLRTAARQNKLKVDVVSYIDMKQTPELLQENRSFLTYQNGLRIGGYKIFLDGSPQGRTAWMKTPYQNAKDGYRGYPVYQDAEAEAFMKTAVEENQQILVHCNGDAAAQQMTSAYANVRDRGKDIRPVMIHAQLVQRQQLAEMARLRMIASFFTAHTYYWGDTHIKNFGIQRASGISPAASAIREGVCYTFHQDTPVIAPNMLETIWCAVCRRTKEGVLLGGSERISVYEALKGVTCNAAYQYFEEAEKGSIEAGKRADFVILDRNPLHAGPERIREIQVLETIKNGETLYKKE